MKMKKKMKIKNCPLLRCVNCEIAQATYLYKGVYNGIVFNLPLCNNCYQAKKKQAIKKILEVNK